MPLETILFITGYILIAFIIYVLAELVNKNNEFNGLYAVFFPATFMAFAFILTFTSIFAIPAAIGWLFKQGAQWVLSFATHKEKYENTNG